MIAYRLTVEDLTEPEYRRLQVRDASVRQRHTKQRLPGHFHLSYAMKKQKINKINSIEHEKPHIRSLLLLMTLSTENVDGTEYGTEHQAVKTLAYHIS